MQNKITIFFYHIALLSLLTCFSIAAYAKTTPAGQVIAAMGSLQAVQENGVIRDLQRRSEFFAGDTLITADNTEAQLHFTDGTLVALRPNTSFKITSYRYKPEAQGKSKGAFSYLVELIEGGLRTISGAIAKADPTSYKIETAVATIGVRGTEFSVIYTVADGLMVTTYQGMNTITNSAGEILTNTNTGYNSAIVRAINQMPKGLNYRPRIFNSDPQLVGVAASNFVKPGGKVIQKDFCIH